MSLFFPDSFLQEVMDRNDIVDIVSGYVKLKRSGSSLKGLCPFHKEKTPSFHVSADKQLYYCFGCSNGGTVINFVMQAENLDFIEAVKYLADRANLTILEPSGKADDDAAHKKKIIYKINTASARFFHECLMSDTGKAAREYISLRKLTASTVNRFGLGYAPEGNMLYRHLKEQGFDDEQIIQSAVVIKNDNGDIYDRFRNRLMFPIIDIRKNIVGFGGRVLGDSSPKYLNSPETTAFNKSYNLFGLNLAKSTKDNFFILVEGYMDVISLHQNGITSAIATLGTALTPEQARIIKRLKSEVVIAYDSDEAGQNATRRAIELLSAEDITVRVLTMGDCKDPDEYIKKNGRGAFWELVKNAKLQIEYKISKLQEKYNLEIVEEKVKYINELATEFAKIKSPVEREIYINKISSETGVSASAISKETERICAINERKSKISTFSPSLSVGAIKNLNPKKENILRAERLLLNLMSTDKDIAQMAEKALESSDFEEGMHRDLFELFISIYASGAQPDIRLIASQIKDSALILHDNQYIEDKNLAAKELISLIKAERAKRKLLETVTSENITMQQKLTEMEKCLRRKVGSDEQR